MYQTSVHRLRRIMIMSRKSSIKPPSNQRGHQDLCWGSVVGSGVLVVRVVLPVSGAIV